MVMNLIGEDGRRRVSAAITDAEKRTSGEIVAVITPDSASHLSVPFLIAAAVALFLPWPLIYFTWMTVQWIYALQLAVFLLVVLALMPRSIRFRFVPRRVLHNRAHRRAVEQFRAQDLDTTAGRTGVLLFVSVAERYAEIIADTGLHKKVEQSAWQGIIDELTAEIGAGRADNALVQAIGRIGDLMATHFPAGQSDVRRLPDHLIVLE
jgi:putative membrane protein